MAYPDILTADDYDAVRALLGVTEFDVKDDLIDQLPYGPQAEAVVMARLEEWETLYADPPTSMLMRMATSYIAAALIAETYVKGGVVGLVSGQNRTDYAALSVELWARANGTITELVGAVAGSAQYDLAGLKINGPTRSYNRTRYGSDWWKYPPVFRATGIPIHLPPEDLE